MNTPMPTKPADAQNRDGLMAKVPETKPSQGSGTGGGLGSEKALVLDPATVTASARDPAADTAADHSVPAAALSRRDCCAK